MGSKFLKLILAIVICTFIITTCKKDHGITDFEVTEVAVTDNTVKVTGKINSLSDSPITAFGVCYSTKSNPVATDTALSLGVPKVGPFTASITSLKRNKTYYFKAFIKEGDNYLYDDVRSATIAAIAPGATSAAASNIGETSATLNGSVNPNGAPATYSFEYGTTTSYGSTATPGQNIVNGESTTAVSTVLSSLSPNTTYHFRLKVTSAGGTVYGEDLTFKTNLNLVAPGVSSVTVTNISNTSATLNASVNPNGSPAKVIFEYGTTFLYGTEVVATPDSVRGIVPTSVTSSLTGLAPGTLYHFRVKAVSAGGTTYSNDQTFTTTQPPSAETKAPSDIGLTSVTLKGLAKANGINTTVSFEYGTSVLYGSIIDGVPASVTGTQNTDIQASLTGLIQNITYHYRLKAESSAGTSFGSDFIFTTLAAGMVEPTLQTNLVTEITQTTATSGGNITSNGGSAITASGICWSTSTEPDVSDSKTSNGSTAGSYTSNMTGLTPGTTYYVRAYATNGVGTGYGQERSFSTATVVVPATITTNIITDVTTSSAVSGGNISNDGGDDITASGICWRTSSGPVITDSHTTDGAAIGSWSSNMTGLVNSTTYYVRAYATNSAGTSYGNERSFTTGTVVINAPSATALPATAITKNSATLNGNVNANGNSTNVTFEYGTDITYGSIITATPYTVTGSNITTVEANITGLSQGQVYHFRVKAVNGGGTTYSNDLTFSTLQPPVAVTQDATSVAQTSATLNGYVNANDLTTTIKFEYGTDLTYGTIINGSPSSTSGTANTPATASLTGLTANTTYHFRIVGSSSAGNTNGGDKIFTTPAIVIDPPVVTTAAISAITQTTATGGGNVTSQGGAAVTARGVCWSTSADPTTANSKTENGTGTGAFTSNLTALTAGTLYYVRAYAANSGGTSYGNTQTFTTESIILPTASTNAASGIVQTAALLNGTINANGLSTTVTFEYGLTTSYGGNIAANESPVSGSTNTAVSANLSGLTKNTLYHYRVKAVNVNGTVYGSDMTFTTLAGVLPTVTTTSISGLNSSGATSGGDVTNPGSEAVTAKGVCWSTVENPVVGLPTKTVDGSGTGSFTSSITGLVASTTYHVRAYATNETGTAYGSDIPFTTSAAVTLPSLTTTAVSAIGTTTATSGGNISNDGGASVTGRGVVWGASANPTIDLSTKTTNGTGTGTFVSNLTSLTASTTYHVRAYATNSAGTAYGNDISFTTNNVPVIPTVITTSATSITTTTASSGGNVTFDGDAAVTERGICWGTSLNPTTSGSKLTSGSGTGSYIINLTGLNPGTTYYIRAYGINSAGTGYGDNITFNTLCNNPTVSTVAASSVAGTSATLNGTVNANSFSTAVTFHYGLTTSYGSTITAVPSPVSGSSNTPVSANITGLLPNTLYHFKVVGYNCGSTVQGSDLTFTTSCVASTATSSAAGGITTTTATLNGIINANNLSATVTFEYGLTAAYGSSINATPGTVTGAANTPVSASISGLAPETTYHFRVKSTNCGGTFYGNDATFTTACVAPASTTNAASGITATAVTLNGNVNANGSSTTVTFQYGLTTGYGTSVTSAQSPVTGSSGTAVSAAVSGLQPNTTYHYRVYSSSCGGNTPGADLTFTTLCSAPVANTNAASVISSTGATMNGTVTAYNSTTTVTFEYGLTTGYGYSIAAVPGTVTGNSSTAVSKAITGLTPNTLYHFRVRGDNCGGTAYSGDQTFTTSCTASVVTTNAATGISQTVATFNGTVNPNYGNATVSFDWGTSLSYGSNVIATQSPVTGSSVVAVDKAMTGLNQNTTYYYRIRVTTCYGTVLGSAQSFTTTCAAPVATTMPASSTNPIEGYATLNASVNASGNSTSVVFEWGLSTAYGNTVTASPSTVSGSANTNVSATITGLTEGTIYYYRVKATSCFGSVFGLAEKFTLDIDGNVYHIASYSTIIKYRSYTVTWMKENLRATSYSDLTPIPPGCDTCTIYTVSRKPWGDNSANTDIYGLLYNGYTVNSAKNICPTGWHVATIDEWNSLINYAGGTSYAGKLKETGTAHWNAPNTGAEDFIGFSARGGGYATSTASYSLNAYSYWWADYTHQYIRMSYSGTEIVSNTVSDDYYFYIRCKK